MLCAEWSLLAVLLVCAPCCRLFVLTVCGLFVLVCVYRSLLRELCDMLGGASSPSCWCACCAVGQVYNVFVVFMNGSRPYHTVDYEQIVCVVCVSASCPHHAALPTRNKWLAPPMCRSFLLCVCECVKSTHDKALPTTKQWLASPMCRSCLLCV